MAESSSRARAELERLLEREPVAVAAQHAARRDERETPGARWQHDGSRQPHEAGVLKLDSSKAKSRLGWKPRWGLEDALASTLAWHRAWRADADMVAFSLEQIAGYDPAGDVAG